MAPDMNIKSLLTVARVWASLKSASQSHPDLSAATGVRPRGRFATAASGLLLTSALLSSPAAWALTYYYFSGGGANGNWSTAANWSVNGVPPANSTNVGIVFLSGANNRTSVLDIAGMTVRSLEFLQVSNHVITSPVARTLTLIGQGRTNPVVRLTLPSNVHFGRFLFDANIELVVSNECTFHKSYAAYVGSHSGWLTNDTLAIAGRISGPGSLSFTEFTTFNDLEVTLTGSVGNTYTGRTTVYDGVVLYLDKSSGSAIPGPLVVDSAYAGVGWLRDNQMPMSAVITNQGSISLNGHNDTLGELHLRHNSSTSGGTGLLTCGGDVIVENGTASISGRWSLGTPAEPRIGRQFFTATGALEVRANISGSAILRKVGDGVLSLLASNSFTGMAVLESGKTVIGHSNALGSTVGSTYIGSAARLSFDGDSFHSWGGEITCAEPLDFADQEGADIYPIAVEAINGVGVTLTGPITLGGETRFYEDMLLGLFIRGPVQGPGSFHLVSGGGGIHLEGTATNTYTGGTFAEYGGVYLNRPGSGRCVPPGGLIVEGDLHASLPNQLTLSHWVVMSNSASLSLGSNQAMASLTGAGYVWFEGQFNLGANGTSSTFSGTFSGFGPNATLNKTGNGTLTLLGANTFNGQTTVSAGQLMVHGTFTNGQIALSPSSTLSGTGAVGQIVGTAGLIMPGPGQGTLNSRTVSLTGSHGMLFEIGGTNSGADADMLRVTGTVTLSNTPLYLTWQTGGKAGNKYLIIDNDGTDPVVGNFSALPQGTAWTYNGIQYQISYTGGTGNDVVITQLTNPPKPSMSRVRRLPGGPVQVEGTGLPGVIYQVESSVSLSPPAWIYLGTATASTPSGLIQFVDADAAFLPMRFYRFLLP